MSLQSKYASIDMAALEKADPAVAKEIKEIVTETASFTTNISEFEGNFNDLYEIVQSAYPQVISAKKEPVKPASPLEVIAPPAPTPKPKPQPKPVAKKKDEPAAAALPEGFSSRKELEAELRRCDEFKNQNRKVWQEMRGTRIKKPKRRSEADIFADRVGGSFKTLTADIKDEKKLERLKKAYHTFINEVRSIIGMKIGPVERKIEATMKVVEKRIEKAEHGRAA